MIFSNLTKGFNYSPQLVKSVYSFLLVLLMTQTHIAQVETRLEAAMEQRVRETLKQNSEILRFMENKGQLEDKNILYYFEGKHTAVYIEKTKIRFVAKDYEVIKRKFLEDESILKGTHTFTMQLDGSNPEPTLMLGSTFKTRYNYFFGENPESWVSGIYAAKDLTLQNVYPGIDIRLYSSEDGSLEFDWIINAGADYHKINMLLSGQDNLSVDRDGSLLVGLRFGDVKFNIPESYQVTETGKIPVNFSFNTEAQGRVNFKTSSIIDPKYPLIIDPILSWGTFMDGNDPDFDQYLFGIQVDQVDGMVYCAGASNRQISTSSAPYDADGYLNVITGFGTTATPRVAILYRVNSGGSDLVDLTLYGPSSVASGDQVAAYALSLSDNRVFIGGRTTVNLPTTGTPFDNSRDGNDGFVAIFSKDLGTLHYASYLGGSGAENLGVTSVRAVDDNTYVLGLTAMAALPSAYITSGVVDNTFGGGSEMYIAKFNNTNTLVWGTYVGGPAEETFNDLEVFSDGRVAFTGWGNNTTAGFPAVNPASSGSNSTADTDGLMGVLNSSATAYNYAEEVGGSGNDRINDIEIINGIMAWTGSVSSGFPTSSGAYDTSHNGGTDVVVGTVSTSGGAASYKATFFGGGGNDIGSGLQKVSQTKCDGSETSFLLVFGTTAANATGIPTVNINNEPFYSATNQGGLDIFFAAFNESMTTLQYATNMGGQYNDYLGDTGDPRGANHLWVKGANVYVGTTTHSATHIPALVGGGGFDQTKTNHANPTSDDTHIIFSIQFSSILETDYSDAPVSYGTPSHILDCTHLRINSLDAESASIPTTNADGDDLNVTDDEDGISTFPVYTWGGPQTISVTVNSIINSTGATATLYGWIDFNNDGKFTASEFTSTTVANGFAGSKTLTWSGVTITDSPSNQYLRIRLTTNSLNDDASTTNVDERSTESASNGEVEDYYICVKPNAGTDKNVSCINFPGGSTTMTSSGTGSWAAQAGNPGTATITTPSSPTTTITNFSTAGTYNFIWTNATGCAKDTVSVIVSGKPNAGADKNVNCITFPGGSASMSASGTGTWSAQAGNPGTATITSPASPTTTITNFSAAGTYNFIWTIGSCTDTASVFVTAKPNAGADQSCLCVVSFPGASVTMAATGSGTWTAQAGNPGTATIVSPSSPTTVINNFSGPGNYYYIWTNASGCTDTAIAVITAKPDAGPDKAVNCVASFPGGSATMAAVGTGTWSAQAGNPGTATISNSNSPTTTIINYSTAGTYNFIWTNSSNCTDTASVVVTAKPNAGPDKSVDCVTSFPGGSATMSATGTGTWSAQAGNPGTATISNSNSPTTTIINYSAAGTYNFIWTNSSNCTDTASVVVTAKPNAGTDQSVSCIPSFPGGSATMSATGTGTWSAQAGNPGTATISNSNSPTTTIINFSTIGTYHFIWTNGSGCTDTASIFVTSKPNAGGDKTVDCVASFPGGSTTMSGTGTGNWTAQTGNPGPATIATPTSPTTIISNFSSSGVYNFIWTSASGCTDTASVTVTSKPNAGSDKTVDCVVSFPGGSTTMSATGSGTWSPQAGNPGTATISNSNSPTTTIINFSAIGTYNFIWTNASGCSDTASVTVTSKPNAGSDKSIDCVVSFPGGSTTMSATGTGTWSAQAGNPGTATISNNNSPTTTIINFSNLGTYNFIWTNASGCTDTASVVVTAKPNAGSDKQVNCLASFPGGSATMSATGTGTWSAQAGNPGTATISNANSPTTTIINYSTAGTYNFIWTNSSNCTDTASVVVTAKPNAGPDKSVDCVTSFPGGSATMSATGTGTWSAQAGNPGTATISNNNSPTTTIINFSAIGTYNFIWTNASGCTDTASVVVTAKPNAGTDQSVSCIPSFPGGSATMSATGTGTWSAQAGNPGTATISNSNSPTTTIINFSTIGTYHFIWTNGSGCTDTASIFVTSKPNAGGDKTVDCVASFPGGSATMSATGTGTWSAQAGNPGPATISNANTPTTSIINYSAVGTYYFIWTNGSGCTDTASVVVTAKPNAGSDKTVNCVLTFPGGSATMTATGAGTWSAQVGNPGTATISNVNSPTTTIINFSVEGTYYFIWTNSSNCSDTVSIAVSKGPIGSASPQTICSGETTSVALNSTVPGTTYSWTATQFSGGTISGYSNCNSGCGTTITQTLNNASSSIAGVVRYAVTPTAPNGCVGNSFYADITVNPKPQGSGSPQTICSGETTSVSVNSTIPGTSFTWTAAQFSGSTITGFSNCGSSCGTSIAQSLINTSNSTAGVVRYTVIPKSPEGCIGNPFTIDVTVNPKPTGSASPQTICSGSTSSVSLNSSVPGSSFTWTAAQFSGSTITGFSNCASSCGTSIAQTLTNTTNTAAGVVRYTIIPKSPEGCTGNPFIVDVTVNPLPVVNVNTTPACIGISNGTATALVSGGNSPYTYLWSNSQTSSMISGLAPGTYTVTATDSKSCKNTGSGTVLESGISSLTAIPGICQSLTNTYSLTGNITFQNAPNSGTLTVSADGIQQVFNAPFTSPQAYVLNGLTADGAVHTVTAIFSGGANCSKSTNFTSPANCSPVINHNKTFISYTQTGINTYDVIYKINVTNSGGAGFYDLSDKPSFDDDIAINSASYTSDAPGNPGSALAGIGPWILANDQGIAANSVHMFTLKVNVTINLNPLSGGDNMYKKCGTAIPGLPSAGEGLFNESSLDTNNDGIAEEKSKACGDLPYVTHDKTITSINPLGGNMHQVNYQIVVKNIGGAAAQYDLTDVPGFDNDIDINTASYLSNAPGNAGGVLAGSGPWSLANDQNIAIGAIHTYQLTVKVTLNLKSGSGGDNIYKKCGQSNPGNPVAGEGLYNKSRIDTNNDGIAEETKEVCGDLPYVTSTKTFITANPLGGNMYNVIYQLELRNLGGVAGNYSLSDLPTFDNDISINSASFTSTAPGNPGGVLAGTGPWNLASNQIISAGDLHIFTLTVKVTLDLKPGSGGDDIYKKCGTASQGNPTAGEGLYNESRMDSNNDGIPEEINKACGDLPYVTSTKTISAINPLGGNMYNVVYKLEVKNLGGVTGQYDLTDIPGFDDDIIINSANYTTTVPANPGGALAPAGPWILANDQLIPAGITYTYTLTVKVTIDLSSGSPGDNVYKKCGLSSPGNPVSGEGLYNESKMDSNNDGIPEEINKVCGDIPYVTHKKSIAQILPLGSNMYKVVYKVEVKNLGGANGQYDLKDTPGFDDDFTINTASFTTDAPGNPGGVLAGNGPWTLANDQNILVGATHTFTLEIKVTLDLTAGTPGDNMYKKCGSATPGTPKSGEGLYNESSVDSNNDGTPEETSKVCDDVPYVTHKKSIAQILPLGGNMYKVVYKVEVKNLGGANGQYDLKDTPGFDDDFTINTASFTTDAPGNPGGVLAGNGPWTLANDQNILVGATHTFTLEIKVTLDLTAGTPGDNMYKKCGSATPGTPKSGEGLFNESSLDSNNDGEPEEKSKVCDDVPYVTHKKSIAQILPLGSNMYKVVYKVEVKNLGGANGQYDLKDTPGFDDDFTINTASFTTDAPGNPGGVLAGNGPWTLANDQNILVGATHTFTLEIKVTLDLTAGTPGDNMYKKCGSATPGTPKSGEGLYNESSVDSNNDGTPEETSKVCDDVPYVTHKKSIAQILPLGGNMYKVVYKVEVKNLGGANGQYDLKDTPGFDDDFTINTASFTTDAPGNPGGVLAGNGPWTLANDQNILVGATHTFTLEIKVTLDLTAGTPGDNMYKKCGSATPGTPKSGEGLYNESSVDSNNDGTPEETSKVCDDVPYVTHKKSIAQILPLGGNMYKVVYKVEVKNLGGANGQYDLKDTPGFDDDFTINTASFTTDAPGNPGGVLAGNGPWTLANDQNILVGATHTFTLEIKVTLDLTAGTPGDNMYKKCGSATPGTPKSGEGLFNESSLDSNNDGEPEEKSKVCDDVPYVTHKKSIAQILPLGGNMYKVVYKVEVKNLGGANGQYDLKDTPGFDDDFTINTASFTTDAPGNPGGVLAGNGPWTLANDQNILVGATHTFTLEIKVTLDLTAGTPGDNMYKKCGSATPGTPKSGEGLYNESSVDSNNDGTPEETSKVCDDVPYVTHKKSIAQILPLGGNMYKVVYKVEVKNLGGANGQYDLKDTPGFDDDFTINTASFTTDAPGNPGGVLAGNGPWTLANDQNILVGATHTFTLEIKVTLDLTAGTPGDNMYKKCGSATPGTPKSGEGLYNESSVDSNNDGTPEETSKVCDDVPFITHTKTIVNVTNLGGNMYNVTYSLDVRNLGGANGQYDLTDSPSFDNDININNASYTSTAPGNPGAALIGNGPWTLANDQSILAGALHNYTLTVKVIIDLKPGSGGDDIYRKCGQSIPANPSAGEGLFNESKLDSNNDGIPEETKKACGDLPYLTHNKTITNIQDLGGNMYQVTYKIEVKNLGGASGHYVLTDAPGFDNDIAINNASYSSNAVGNPGGVLAGIGPWTLAVNQNINSGDIHTYHLVVKVTLDLSVGSGGDNIYKSCGQTTPGNPTIGEGLFNESRLDNNGDGIPEEKAQACGDLPYIINQKTLVSTTDLGGNMYQVNYQIVVRNLGGATGKYDLIDAPSFDNDININTASYTSSVLGNPGGILAGSGPWQLANDLSIPVGVIHTYQLSLKVTIDLNSGSGGDNIYRKCGQTKPGDPSAGEGLYNESFVDTNNDGIPENKDKACGDLPYLTIDKTVSNISALGGNMYSVTYQLEVKNAGGADGKYDLTDAPGFDNDIDIISASFSTNAPFNPGGILAGIGPWTLATDQSILVGASHTYQLVVKVKLDLTIASGGDNVYKKCGTSTPGVPRSGEGLYNEGKIDTNKDGIPEAKDNDCADLPYITHTKTLSTTIQNLGGNMYNVTYNIEVKNIGGATGQYDLTDVPGFDNDISINGASYTSSVAGNPGGVLAGAGPWVLANNQIIAAGVTHSYQIVVKLTLDLTAGSGGDNIYRKCGQTTQGTPVAGEGLFNESRVDTNDDGIPEETSKACGDLPYIVNTKTLVSTTPLGGNMYTVNYKIEVQNLGGASGKYDLKDTPGFDDDISINTASYSSSVAGNPGGPLAGIGPWTLANDQNIAAGGIHTYQLSIKVSIDLSAGSAGDNVYKKCGSTTPGTPKSGEGLFNESSVDTNDDGIPENKDKACGDLPYVTHKKSVAEIAPLGGNSYKVTYLIEVRNIGGANGNYGLIDAPSFDDDVTINNASFTSNAPGNPGSALAGSGPWTLAINQNILTGAMHTYALVVNVNLNLSAASGGDNVYRKCGQSSPGNPSAGEGLFNESLMDNNNDGVPEEKSKVCADLPYVTHKKTLSLIEDLGGNMYQVTYKLEVKNLGGANGLYNLLDAPGFENDITINSASYSSNSPGNPGGILIGPGPWTLANNQAIAVAGTHTYQLVVKITLDLKAGSGGDNVYRKCGQTNPGDPSKGEGLFNESKLDSNNDGIPEETDKACGDIPYVIHSKQLTNIAPLGGNMYHVTYQMNVRNIGGATGVYDLVDTPGFDDDITINGASYTANVPGNPGSGLAGSGPWLLANNQSIPVGDLHTYILTVKVSLDLSNGSGGDNVYRKCGQTTPGIPSKGEGLFNKSTIDTNNDGTPENDDYACDDLPYIINQKTLGTITPLGGNMYQVNYLIEVRNIGGASGLYDLTDIPGFDNDITINSALYTSNVLGNPGSALIGSGPWKLANDISIPTGVTHSYQLSVKLTLDLHPLSGGDNVYKKCGQTIPGSPSSGEGLFNRSEIDTNNDGIPEHSDKVCGDLPYVTSTKTISSITPLSGNMFNIVYQLQVKNLGGATGQYDLTDVPGFDDDITINSASFTSDAPGLPGSALAGSGPWKLANDQNIIVGATHTFMLTVKVTLDLTAGSGGDNIYKKCGQKIPGEPTSGEGIYNELRMDSNNDGIPEETPKVCADLPYVTHEKQFTSVTSLGSNNYQVVYTIIVKNLGGANGMYDLTDAPGFDDDITINSASFISTAVGNPGAGLFGSGPWTLADDQTIVPGGIQTYTLTVKVKYDSSPGSGGDNIYRKCGLEAVGKPVAGEGLFNESRLDNNNDGIPEEKSRVCGDLPDIAKYGSYVWNDKNGNGQRDFGEEGIPNVTVILYDAVTKLVERTLMTDANGKYLFENLKSKSYYAKYMLPSGWVFSPANQGPDATDSDVDGSNGAYTNATTFLDYGQESLTNDAGMMRCATISGDVWFDIDMDGIYDPNEKGINGLYVYIIDAMTGATVSTLKTSTKPGTPSDDGYYKSDCLKPGMYYVKFERPGHLGASLPYQGGNPTKDSDINHEFGINTSTKITVNSGDVIVNIGAGFQTKSQVGDRVWIDQNFNGIQDSGEKPLAGVKVSAYNKQGVKISESESDTYGQFILDGMTQGDFYVKFEAPAKYSFTLPRAGVDEIDSDVDGTFGYGSTRMFKVQAGEVRPTIDAGVVSQVLALEWLEFTGQYNGDFTELNWKTGIEDNNDHFVIERKHESEKDFSSIGQVAAHPDPNLAQHDYQYDDFEVNKSGIYYYRLKQVDRDGRYTFSKTIAIRVTDKYDNLNVDIYPNPASDLLKLELWLPEDSELEVSVFDKNGKAVLVAPFNQFKTKGRYNELLQLSSLITGQYVLQIKTSSDVIYKKFTVSR